MKKAISEYEARLVPVRSRLHKLYILCSFFVACTLFYYFGELVDFAGWQALRWDLFYGVHDVHRLLFLAPIIYAGYVFGLKAAVIITIVSAGVMIPRALFISTYPYPTLRMVIFIVVAGVTGYLAARTRSELERRSRFATLLRGEKDRLLGILERMQDGVLIVGPDYRIRFMNSSMTRDFGEGVGSYCYVCIHKRNAPCPEICRLPNILSGAVETWQYSFPDGRTYELIAAPYLDSDGTACQLATFRKIIQHRKS